MNVGSIFELANRTGLWVYCGVHREDDRVRKVSALAATDQRFIAWTPRPFGVVAIAPIVRFRTAAGGRSRPSRQRNVRHVPPSESG